MQAGLPIGVVGPARHRPFSEPRFPQSRETCLFLFQAPARACPGFSPPTPESGPDPLAEVLMVPGSGQEDRLAPASCDYRPA